MPEYGLYSEKTGKLTSLSKQEARNELKNNLADAISDEEKQKHMSDYLTGIHSGVRFRSTRKTLEDSSFGNEFKDILSSEERRRQTRKSGTELFRKATNDIDLRTAEKERSDKQKKRARDAAERAKISISDPDLMAISRFMKGSSKGDADLVIRFKSPAGKQSALLDMIRRFMKYRIDSIDVSSDDKIAVNARTLEDLSEKLASIHYLITTAPETYNKCDEPVITHKI